MMSASVTGRLGRNNPSSRVSRVCGRWIVWSLALTALVWTAGLAGLLDIARRVHVDIPPGLAMKLPLLQLKPELIFAGESRTHYGIDAAVAAERLGKPPGYAVNIAYDAGEPLALLAAVKDQPAAFRNASVVVSVAPFLFNEGVKSASVYPLDVAARLSVREQFAEFFPLRIGVMIRFITTAFQTRLAQEQDIAHKGPLWDDFGVNFLTYTQPPVPPTARLSAHRHYAGWDLSGPRARFETAALCDIVPLVKKLTVVMPPWSIAYDRDKDDLWRSYEADTFALLSQAGQRCGFDVLNIPEVPGLTPADFADEMHVNKSGVPIYTRYLVDRLKP